MDTKTLCLLPLLALSGTAVSADAPLPVELIPVSERSLWSEASSTGTIVPVDSIEMGFRAGGRLDEVLVEAGDQVKAGDALARTDPLQQDQALRVAEAALAAARAAQEQALQADQRARALLDRGVGTRAAADQAHDRLSQAEGASERAQTAVEQARRAVEDTVLRAPVDAIVTERAADPGEIVAPAQPVLTLAARSGLEATFHISDSPRLDQALGVAVRLHAMDVAAPVMTGHVTEVSPLVDPRNGAVAMRVRIDDPPQNAALLGTAVRGVIRYPQGQGIPLPWTALSRAGASPAVWVVAEDGSVSIQPIEIDSFLDGQVIVRSGLAAGQTVVGAGSQMLYPGRKVVAAKVAP